MAVWAKFASVRRFAEVRDLYGDPEFRNAVIAEARGTATWARYGAGTTKGDLDIQVDVTAIPLVRPLTVDGHIPAVA